MLSTLLANSQQVLSLSNLRTKKISTKSSTVKLDTLSIVPKSIVIPGIANDQFLLDEVNAELSWLQPQSIDTVTITYRVFPYKLNAQVQRLKFDDVRNNFLTTPITLDNNPGFGKSMFDFGNVNYNGSFGRGISFGNNKIEFKLL